MQYTKLGSSGLGISRIALGCMSYGTPAWRPWVLDAEASKPFFQHAVELGINFFDTADMYSLGAGEEVTGRWLREFANLDETVIATKVFFPMGEGPNMGGLSRKHIIQACEASLRRLGVETIDLYQVHRHDPTTPIEETLEALDHLVRQGKVRYIGASSMYAYQLMRALSVSERQGWARFVSMQNHYNLIYREEEREMIPLCREEGVGVVPWSPLARGLLAGTRTKPGEGPTTRSTTDRLDELWYDDPSDWDVVDAVRAVAEDRGEPPARIALAWLVSRPGVAAPIIGATKLSHLDDAVAALAIDLTDEEVERLEAPYRPHRVIGMEPPRTIVVGSRDSEGTAMPAS
jgi:aryl-alcohol dehydrogenase-like predicted oxidoreductase